MSLVGRCALPWWLKRNDCFAFQIPFAHSALLRREHGLLIEKKNAETCDYTFQEGIYLF